MASTPTLKPQLPQEILLQIVSYCIPPTMIVERETPDPNKFGKIHSGIFIPYDHDEVSELRAVLTVFPQFAQPILRLIRARSRRDLLFIEGLEAENTDGFIRLKRDYWGPWEISQKLMWEKVHEFVSQKWIARDEAVSEVLRDCEAG